MPTLILPPDENANAFISTAEMDSFFADDFTDAPTWSETQKEIAILAATRTLSAFNWVGSKTTAYADNPLPFPDRTGVQTTDGQELPTDEIPYFLIAATSYLAADKYNISIGASTTGDATSPIKSLKASVLAITFDTAQDQVSTREAADMAFQLGIPVAVYELIRPYVEAPYSNRIRLCR